MGFIFLSSLVDWSRWQFALTACYHWLFVPLTLGLGIMIAIMESIYLKTGKQEWKNYARFWMRLFGVNFAIGVATGLILEFQFGTNWSNYSWFVGDIFGAPLAIEGIFAFFLEATFMAVMFFGWNKVSKKFHLFSTWMVAIGANLSAFWILVANAWMQDPVGMQFNPDTARNEMLDFFAIAFSDMAIYKFTHTVSSAFLLGSVFVMGVSAWFLLKGREHEMAKQSMKIAVFFGLFSSLMTAFTGDGSAYTVAQKQPMKLAAMEGLYEGTEKAGIVVFGILNPQKNIHNQEKAIYGKIEVPGMLSILAKRDINAFVPGINDLILGNREEGILSTEEKMARGKIAIQYLKEYKEAQKIKDEARVNELALFFKKEEAQGASFYENYFRYFGYGYLDKAEEAIPNIGLSFYSFRIMILLGGFFILLFAYSLWILWKGKMETHKPLLYTLLFSIPLVYICSMSGWIVAEVGRQPWIIQDLMPTKAALSDIGVKSVQTSFWIFVVLFTSLLIAELRILCKQISKGSKED